MNKNMFQMGLPVGEREYNDLYCTDPKTVELLLSVEKLNNEVWEPANGLSHISDCLERNGYNVKRSDIINYDGKSEVMDFLKSDFKPSGDIITNPPYKLADDFVRKALEAVKIGKKVILYLKVNYLASQKRRDLFAAYPPKVVYVLSKRYSCAKNGVFGKYGNGAVDYCWFVWEKGYTGNTVLKWI